MKIKEFIEAISYKNYDVKIAKDNSVFVLSSDGYTLAEISGVCMGKFSIQENIAIIESMEERACLIDWIACLAKTPIEERTESKKYYVRHKWLGFPDEIFLNANRDDLLFLNTKLPYGGCRTIFTEEEIESLKRKNDTDLKDFELIEVEE